MKDPIWKLNNNVTVNHVLGFLLNGTVKSIQEDLKDADLLKHYLNVSTNTFLVCVTKTTFFLSKYK